MTPGEKFQSEVRATEIREGLDWNQSWEATRRAKPELFAEMQQPADFANSKPAVDPVKLAKKTEARTKFLGEVHKRMEVRGEDYDKSYAACSRIHVELYNDATAAIAEPSDKELCGQLGLALAKATPQEIKLAAAANKNSVPINAVAIVNALRDYWQKQDGTPSKEAQAKVLQRHPTLMAHYNVSGSPRMT